MKTLQSYPSPQAYLAATEAFLLQNELENNLILGLCYNFPDQSAHYPHCNFLNILTDGEITTTAINTMPRVILASKDNNAESMKLIVEYYNQYQQNIDSVFAKTETTAAFAAAFPQKIKEESGMILHQLTKVKELPISEGILQPATSTNLDLIVDWMLKFDESVSLPTRKKRTEVLAETKNRIEKQTLFKWMVAGEMTTICVIVRETAHYGLVGYVYTPPQQRNKGYATACVLKLSEKIIKSGKFAGLFTDKNNPTSNAIYKRIGYEAVCAFTGYEFE